MTTRAQFTGGIEDLAATQAASSDRVAGSLRLKIDQRLEQRQGEIAVDLVRARKGQATKGDYRSGKVPITEEVWLSNGMSSEAAVLARDSLLDQLRADGFKDAEVNAFFQGGMPSRLEAKLVVALPPEILRTLRGG